MKQNLFQSKTVPGQTITVGRFTLTPHAKVLTLRLPFGGFVWNRADAVLVEEEGGLTKRYPVVNATRIVRLALFGGGLIFMIVNFLTRKQRKEGD